MIIPLKYVYIRQDVGRWQAFEMLFKCYADTTYVQVAVTVSYIACSRHLYIFLSYSLCI